MTHRFIPRLSPEEIARQQLEGLCFTVRQAFKSPQYRKRLEACGVTPDDITSLDDLRRLPTVDVEDLREYLNRNFLSKPRASMPPAAPRASARSWPTRPMT